MSKFEKAVAACGAVGAGLASWLKVMLRSGRPSPAVRRGEGAELTVLGNGPSLNRTIEENGSFLMGRDRLAVNFAANAPQFAQLRPQFYVLADPHFFTAGKDANVDRLWDNLRAADWGMTLYVPAARYRQAAAAVGTRLTVKKFNLTPGEGTPALVRPLYDKGLAMPRPRNVLIPSLMIAMREGYRRIYIAGADHTWTRTLGVDDRNRVVSVQPHFYKDDKKEQTRVNTEYAGYRLHDILYSMYVAFRSYHTIAAYASRRGVSILNITPDSMIDAFPRLRPDRGFA
ncbi:MAG: hypothetical protein J6L73_08150 [Muribaculaceae bacterium]|nr:hypothetical protein [Muribaculaceae bacterium]